MLWKNNKSFEYSLIKWIKRNLKEISIDVSIKTNIMSSI